MNPLDAIPSYVGLGDSLATAGQPSEEQLAAVAAAGFRMVINLGLHDDPSYALADERACVTSLGMRYVHIPVPFANPTLDALMAFSTAMQEAEGDKVNRCPDPRCFAPREVGKVRGVNMRQATPSAPEVRVCIWSMPSSVERHLEN